MAEFNYMQSQAHYRKWLDAAESDEKAVGWHQQHSQRLHFKELLQISKNIEGASILDVGCGIGGLLDFLSSEGINVKYTGVDLNKGAISEAKKRHPEANFLTKDILETTEHNQYDYVFISGTLNHIIPDHENFVKKVIIRAYELCKEGLAFNMLSFYALTNDIASQYEKDFYYASPEAIFAFCMGLSPRVSLNHDITKDSFFVFVYKHYSRLLELAPIPKDDPEKLEEVTNWYFRSDLYREIVDTLGGDAPLTANSATTKGLSLLMLNRLNDAREAFKEAIKLKPDAAIAYIYIGYTFLKEGKTDEAKKWMDKATEFKEDFDQNLEVIVDSYLQFEKWDEAREYADKIERETPKKYFLANDYARNEDYDKALELCQKLLEKHPNFVSVLFLEGQIYSQKQMYKEAYETFAKVLNILPNYLPAKNEIARVLLTVGEYDAALNILDQITESIFTIKAKGYCFFKKEKYEVAKTLFKRAKKLNPYDNEAENYLKEIKKALKKK